VTQSPTKTEGAERSATSVGTNPGHRDDASLARRLTTALLRPQYALPSVTLALIVYLTFANEYFLTERNVLNVTQSIAVVGIAAAFATIVVISGGIDLSPVVIFIVAGMVCRAALVSGVPVPLAVVLGVGAGGAIGLLNGLLISVGNLNPFIVTLGTNFLFTGMAFVVTEGNGLLIENESFRSIGTSNLIGNVPTITVIMVAAFALAFGMLRYTRFGVHVFAIGGDTNAARLSGVPVLRVKTLVYVVAGLAAGAAGVVLAASSGSVAPFQAAGQNDLLTILAAVIIGGTALEGGRGTIVGTLVGLLLLAIISNGLVLQNISSFWQPVVVGTVLLLAIILDEARRRASLKVAN
jgi:ribose transport system permease protein